MTTNLAEQGIQLVKPASYVPNTTGTMSQPIHTPWTESPFDHLECTRRIVDAAKEQIHPSVKQRWQADPSYRPAPLIGFW
jgi:hypothetical protein